MVSEPKSNSPHTQLSSLATAWVRVREGPPARRDSLCVYQERGRERVVLVVVVVCYPLCKFQHQQESATVRNSVAAKCPLTFSDVLEDVLGASTDVLGASADVLWAIPRTFCALSKDVL